MGRVTKLNCALFSPVFVHTCGSVLPSRDCGTSHFHWTDIFLTFLCFPRYLSTAGALPNLGPPQYMSTLGRNPNLLIWGPRQGLTEAKKATTRPQTLLYPVSERSITDLRVCEHLTAWSRWTEKVLLKYPLKKEDSPRLLVQVSLYCSWPISFRYLLC